MAAGATSGLVSDILLDLARLNLLFAGLNALPGFPLDGGRVLLAGVWGATRSRRTGMRAAGYGEHRGRRRDARLAVYDFSSRGGYWLFLGYVGFILISTGRAMDQRIALRDQLATGTVAEAMRPPPPSIPASMALTRGARSRSPRAPTAAFPVVGGRSRGRARSRSRARDGSARATRSGRSATAMVPLDQIPTVAPDEPLDDALEWLGGRESLVLRDGVLVGAIGPADVERWYRRVIEGRLRRSGAGRDRTAA